MSSLIPLPDPANLPTEHAAGSVYKVQSYRRTRNLGDAIQTLALQRLLPAVRYAWRDTPNEDDGTTFVVNGWLGGNSPCVENADCLFAGVFVNDNEDNYRWMRNTRFAEIGARDPATVMWCADRRIRASLIGCATLSFDPYHGPRAGRYAVHAEAAGATVISHDIDEHLAWPEQLALARSALARYQRAECVITSRLHVALPCLAFGTPVIVTDPMSFGDPSRIRRFSLLDTLGLRYGVPFTCDVTWWRQRYIEFLQCNLGIAVVPELTETLLGTPPPCGAKTMPGDPETMPAGASHPLRLAATPPEVTICVLTHGDHTAVVRRCLESIRKFCPREKYRLVVGGNAVCGATRSYLEGLQANEEIDELHLSEENLYKCPMMRRMFAHLQTEFVWWFDDDSFIESADALTERCEIARRSPAATVLWGHVFYASQETDFSYGADVVGFVQRAPWYRGKNPPSWAPGGRGESNFRGQGTGDGRWFYVCGATWFMRARAIVELDWPDPVLIQPAEDVFLCEAVRQQGWALQDIGPLGVRSNEGERRGSIETVETMRRQVEADRTPKVTICVLTYGNHPDLAKRCIESIRKNCARSEYRLIVGANEVCPATALYLQGLQRLGHIDRLIVSEQNINKCPMMRRMFAEVETEFIWWFDDDSLVADRTALRHWREIAMKAPAETVMWGHVFFFGSEGDFSYGTDVTSYVRSASWYRGKNPPSWKPGGKDQDNFEGKGTGDGRWFFATGGCWMIRTETVRALNWPDATLVKRNDDVLLYEAIRQQGWRVQDVGSVGVKINGARRRGTGEDAATMQQQMKRQPCTCCQGKSPGAVLHQQETSRGGS